MSRCRVCCNEVGDDVAFCGRCGTPLTHASEATERGGRVSSAQLRCPSCGVSTSGQDSYCGRCGTSLIAAAGAAPFDAPDLAATGPVFSAAGETPTSPGVALDGEEEPLVILHRRPRPHASPPVHPTPPDGRAFTPGWLVAGLVFAVSVWSLLLLTIQVLSPAILSGTRVEDLQGGIRLVTTLMLLCSLVAGALGGLAGGWQARRARTSTQATFIHASTGPLVAAGVFVVVGWLRHEATPLRATIINLLLVLVGALAGGGIVHLMSRGRGLSVSRRRLVVTVSLLAVFGAGVGPSGTGAETSYKDIEPNDCTVRAVERSFEASITLASVDVGGNFAFRKEEQASGKWAVAVTYEASGGLKLSIGGKLARAAGLSLDVSASGHLTLAKVNQYEFETEAEADGAIRWAAGPYLSTTVALPGVASADLPLVSRSSSGASVRAERLRSTQIKLGGHVKLEMSAIALSAELELGNTVAVALGSEHSTSTSTVTDPDEVTLGLDLNALAQGAVNGTSLGLSGDGELSLSFKREEFLGQRVWRPDALKIGATADGSAKRELDFGPLLKDVKYLKALGLSFEGKTGLTFAAEASVPELPKHPATLGALTAFLASLAPAFSGKPVDERAVNAASDRLAASFAREADIGVTLVENSEVSGNLEVSMGEGLTYGAVVGGGQSNEKLLDAWYRSQLASIAPSVTCVARSG